MKEKREFHLHFTRFFVASIIVIVVAVLLLFAILWRRNEDWDKGEEKESQEENEIIELELVYAYQNAQWNAAIEQTVAAFNETHPNIRVIYQIHYENTVYEKILNKLIARDQLGDIVQII